MKKNLLSLTKHKYVFYVVSLLAILHVLGYFSMRSWHCIVMFAAVAYSTKCYAKNNVIALLAGLFVANFVFGCNRVKENFEEANTPINKAIEAMGKVDEQLEQTEEACSGRDGKWDEESKKCTEKAIEEAAIEKNAMAAVQKQMAGMKGMQGMTGMLSALTKMGK